MKTAIEWITPEIARALLLSNSGNRALRDSHVRRLAQAMRDGQWQLTHQGIAINTNGVVADGQHRLQAVIESSVAVQMMVTRGVPADCFMAMDSGITRTISDQTGIPRWESEVARFMIENAAGKSFTHAGNVKVLVEMLRPTMDVLFKIPNRNASVFGGASYKAAAAYWIEHGHADHVVDVLSALCSAKTDSRHAIVRTLLEGKLKNRYADKRNGGTRQKLLFAEAMYSLNPVYAGNKRLTVSTAMSDSAFEKLKNYIGPIFK